MNLVLPAVTSLLSLAFALILLTRFASRPRGEFGVWTLGLVFYALASGTEALGAAQGWNVVLYRTWYITGAIGVAAYLGAGTIYLQRQDPGFGSLAVVCVLVGCIPALASHRATIGAIGLAAAATLTAVLNLKRDWFAHAAFAILLVTSAAATFQIVNAQVDVSMLPTNPDQVVSGQAFDPDIRILSPAFNIAGAAVLALGAVLSALRYWRTRAVPQRVASNVLIAVGAFIPSLASGLTRFGVTSIFFVGELLGVVCLMAGFLLSATRYRSPRCPHETT